MKWATLAKWIVKFAPLVVEAIIKERTAKDSTIATYDGRTVRVIELKPPDPR